MSELLTMQDLANGHLDIKALGEAANGDENTIVTTRTGNTYPSAERAINIMFQNGGLPATPFASKALMTASALADGDYAQVTDDTDNNGLYVKTAGAWVKSGYDPLAQAKGYTDTVKADTLLKVQNVFATKSLMTASTLPNGSNALVNNDTTSTNNGFYKKTAGVWSKTKVLSSKFAGTIAASTAPLLTLRDDATYRIIGTLLLDPKPIGMTGKNGHFIVESFGDYSLQTFIEDGTNRQWVREVSYKLAEPVSTVWSSQGSLNYDGFVNAGDVDFNNITYPTKLLVSNLSSSSSKPIDFPSNTAHFISEPYGDFVVQRLFAVGGNDFREWTRTVRLTNLENPTDWRSPLLGGNVPTTPSASGSVVSKMSTRKVLFLGDSITAGALYTNDVARSLGIIPIVVAFGGASMTELPVGNGQYGVNGVDLALAISTGDFSVQLNSPSYSKDKDKEKIDLLVSLDFNDIDYIVCFYGTNDYAHGKPLGTSGVADRVSIRGAVNYITEKIQTTYPHVKMLWVTPMYRSRISSGDGKNSNDYPNVEGLYALEYVDAITVEAGLLSTPSLDLYRNSSINKYNSTHWLTDGLHPTYPEGHTLIGEKIAGALSSLY